MNTTQLEKEIINALRINSKVYWNTDPELDPNKEFKELIKFVRKYIFADRTSINYIFKANFFLFHKVYYKSTNISVPLFPKDKSNFFKSNFCIFFIILNELYCRNSKITKLS